MQFRSVQDFLNHAQTEIDANRLKLPTLPDIAQKVRQAVADNNATSEQIAAIIASDPALSARLIQLANSSFYRGGQEIKNIQTAVLRLGGVTTRTVVTSLVMQQMFTPKTKVLLYYFQDIWTQSTNIAAICRALSHLAPHLDREVVMLAGLLHQIGKLPILTMVENIPEFRDSPARLGKLLEIAHAPMGKLIMDSWNFPAEIKPVAYEYQDFQRNPGTKADYVDIVQVAFLQNIIGADHPAASVDWGAVPAFAKLGLQTDVEILEIEGVSEDIEQTLSTFF
ncbi:MAG: HDOD domain-containing protein [Methylomonas sp.]|jgi:HD-like signal output (HDOD) protein